jgi:hypothetical protein
VPVSKAFTKATSFTMMESTTAKDQNTTVIPDAFFSPLSYSLSVTSSSRHHQHQPAANPPPPPSARKMVPESTQKDTDWTHLLSFSQEDYATPQSLLQMEQQSSGTTMKEVQDLLSYIENMAFSPLQQPQRSTLNISKSATTTTKSVRAEEEGRRRRTTPKSAASGGLPPRSSKTVLMNRTNSHNNNNNHKAPYPEMTPIKRSVAKPSSRQTTVLPPRRRREDPSAASPPRNTSRYQFEDDDSTTAASAEETNSFAIFRETGIDTELLPEVDSSEPWKRVETLADTVRRALDPEPTMERNADESRSSIVLGTAFADSQHRCTPRKNVVDFSPSKASRNTVSPDRSNASSQQDGSFAIQENLQHDVDLPIRVATPEDARKLLRTAVNALQDARAEREAARQWSDSMKYAVKKWAEEERKLIRCESTSRVEALEAHEEQVRHQATSLSQLEDAVRELHNELQSSNQDRQTTEEELQQLLLEQRETIFALGQQLSSMEQTISEGTRSGGSSRLRTSPKTPLPQFVDKTPRNSGSASTTSSRKIRRRTKDGGHVVVYSNGVRKEVHKDGTTVVRFANGDVETKFAESGTVAYFHAQDRVMQITTPSDGSTLYEYPNRQIERIYPDGSKAILFPDGTKQRISPRGAVENLLGSEEQ